MILTAIVLVYLFGLGVLVLFGLWRLGRDARQAAIRHELQARRLARTIRRVVRLTRAVHALTNLTREERALSALNRAKVADFIDGPPSLRRPGPVAEMSERA